MKFEKFYQGTSVNRWERFRNYPRPHAVPSLPDHWTARTRKWPFRLKLTAWNKSDGAERTQVTLLFLFTYQSVLFHTYVFFFFALFEVYFLRQWLRAKLSYQTKTLRLFWKVNPGVRKSSPVLFPVWLHAMDVKQYRVHICRPTRQWRLNKQSKKEKDGCIKSELRI